MKKLFKTIFLLFAISSTAAFSSSFDDSSNVDVSAAPDHSQSLIESGTYAFQYVENGVPTQFYLHNMVHASHWKVVSYVAGATVATFAYVSAYASVVAWSYPLLFGIGAAGTVGGIAVVIATNSFEPDEFQLSSKQMEFKIELQEHNRFILLSGKNAVFGAAVRDPWVETVYHTDSFNTAITDNFNVGSAHTRSRQVYHRASLIMTVGNPTPIQIRKSSNNDDYVTLWMEDYTLRVPDWFPRIRSVQLTKRQSSEWRLVRITTLCNFMSRFEKSQKCN